ncbi:hypothetical protein [Arthrobacter castelli]|uniref:hypothetical protein n=1 Tax=Arthrobacter castelli TaxID=271431 RepID=UPI0003FD5B5E|nr:hypothetical protein [Arthrobacter castelli]
MTQPETENPHALAAADSDDTDEQENGKATTRAALAAAHEQHTANMLAYLAHITRTPYHDRQHAADILHTIRERLSLNLPH